MQNEAAAALFQVITQRYLKSSIVMTTNLGVSSRERSSTIPWWPQPCSTDCYSVTTHRQSTGEFR